MVAKFISKRGVLLFEIIISIAILSLGLVLLVRSFIASLDAAKIAGDYTKAVSLLEAKIWELEINENIDGSFPAEPATANGGFGDFYPDFIWSYSIGPLADNDSLLNLNLEVSWLRPKRGGKVALHTYMYAE